MNITLKSVPKPLHAQLKESARQNGRSINTEAIAALERQYLPVRLDPRKHLQLIAETQARYPVRRPLTAAEMKAAIQDGRA
ncbi:MAG: Arc family DNA-binding protein [Chthoniobacterales bacterium]